MFVTAAALAAGTPAIREPFANAHVSLMVRIQDGASPPQLADVDIRADGARLRATVRGDAAAGEIWIDGRESPALRISNGRVEDPPRRSIERSLQLALGPAAPAAQANTDRIAGRPCEIVSEIVAPGVTLTRCMWRGLPLSIELRAAGFAFNAAATMVEEGVVGASELQPPAGAPAAPASMSAGR